MNQYMNGWKPFHVSYTLNIMYYYIYQSFLIQPPIDSSNTNANKNPMMGEEYKQHQPQPISNSNMNDDDFNKTLVLSKVQDKIDKMNKIIQKLSLVNVVVSKNSELVASYTDTVCTKNAMIESELENMNSNSEKIETFIENNEGKEISDVDEFVKPEDEISEQMLDYLSEETACEETMEYMKKKYRKKKVDLGDYLDSVRTLSDTQFMCMAQRRKIMSMVSAHSR